ncbi:MAG: AraC family transcriptional regulator [Clostridiales Family XIII bacterium]|jgi:AraC-like DNA-binding protein|nr:AraC family transcriptional regulator [Clostridiales Family XIII bacterium]
MKEYKEKMIVKAGDKQRARRRRNIPKVDIPVQDCFAGVEDSVGFEITDAVELSMIENEAYRPHRHAYYELIYVKESDGRHIIDYTTYENISEQVFVICPGQVHYWEGVTEASGMLIRFNEDFLVDATLSVNAIWELNLLREMSGAGVSIPEADIDQMGNLLGMMLEEHMRKGQEYASVIRSYLNIFLIQAFRTYKEEKTGFWPQQRTRTLCEDFQRLVHHHVAERQSVQFFADRLEVSMGYLNEQVKMHTGLTPGGFIKRAAVTEAKRLIANTNLSMAEIAAALGFNDGSYFCRLFKAEMGMSPMKFRQACATVNKARNRKGSKRMSEKQ